MTIRCLLSSLGSEKLESQALVNQSTVSVLKGVVVDGSVVSHGCDVGSLSELVAGEQVDQEEAGKLKFVLACAEYLLMEEEVGSEEEEESLSVHYLGVLNRFYNP